MTHNVERRASEAETGTRTVDSAALRDPFPRTTLSTARSQHASVPPKSANSGLTRRERRVKDMLLRELKKGSDTKLLSYAEIQNLEKTLNVEWIDEQIASLRKQMRVVPWAMRLAALFYLFSAGSNLLTSSSTAELIFSSFWVAAAVGIGILGPIFNARSARRRIFILDALRELAGADEAGVTLSRAVDQADELIARIVDLELEAESAPAKTIGRVRTHS